MQPESLSEAFVRSSASKRLPLPEATLRLNSALTRGPQTPIHNYQQLSGTSSCLAWLPGVLGALVRIDRMKSRTGEPEDPVGFIQRCLREGGVLWTYHVNMRLRTRGIPRADILGAVESYELVEAYPKDKYLPSYLIYAEGRSGPFHVLFATDFEGNNVRIVTAYRPGELEWNSDLKTRRPPR